MNVEQIEGIAGNRTASGWVPEPPQSGFDRMTELAVRLFGVPVVAVDFSDGPFRVYSRDEIEADCPLDPDGLRRLQRPTGELSVVEDAVCVPSLRENPLVKDWRVRFWACAPLRNAAGERIGALWLLDRRARRFSAEDRQALLDLAFLFESSAAGQASEPSPVGRLIPVGNGKNPFRTLFDTLSEAVIVVDDETDMIVEVNRAVSSVLGYELEELIGKRFSGLFPNGSNGNGCPSISRATLGTTRACPVLRADGTNRLLEATMTGISWGGKNAVMVIFRESPPRMEPVRDTFDTSVSERWAGSIAHDFNNLLTAIIGNVSLAKYRIDDSRKLGGYLVEAERACRQAKELTAQLLALSKERTTAEHFSVVRDVVRDVVRPALQGSNVRADLHLPDDVWPVAVEKGLFGRVIQNLTVNGVQAMPGGGVLLVGAFNRILSDREVRDLPAGKYVEMTVADSGVGIRPEHLSRIFEPFFTTKEQGNGLGLAIAHSIVKKHGGEIFVESADGCGATFRFFLPASAVRAAPTTAAAEPIPGHGRVLILDASASVRGVVAALLDRLGYETETVKDAVDAVAAFRRARTENNPFSAALIDLTAGRGIDGRDVAALLTKLDPQTKIIGAVDESPDLVASEYRARGFAGVVCKPYTLEELSSALHDVLESGDSNKQTKNNFGGE